MASALKGNMMAVLNSIRDNGSEDYKTFIPEATRTNLAEIGKPIVKYEAIQNEFLKALVNKVAFTILTTKRLQNPLSPLKSGRDVPLGFNIEEIFVNRAEGSEFDPSGETVLKRETPDVKSLYHRMNFQQKYKTTVSREQLQTAFTSYDALQSLVDGIVDSLYSGQADDEFILMKRLVSQAVTDKEMKTVTLPAGYTSVDLNKELKKLSLGMTFNSSSYNAFADVWKAKYPEEDVRPVRTITPKEDQIVLMTADTMVDIDTDVLAGAFNLNKAQMEANTIVVDNFGENENIVGVVCDRAWYQFYDNLFQLTSFYNPEGLYTNYWLHVWQTQSYSLFANAVALLKA